MIGRCLVPLLFFVAGILESNAAPSGLRTHLRAVQAKTAGRHAEQVFALDEAVAQPTIRQMPPHGSWLPAESMVLSLLSHSQPVSNEPDIVVDARASEEARTRLFILMLQGIISLVLWVALTCICAAFYMKDRKPPLADDAFNTEENRGTFKEWKHGMCSCFDDLEICLCAFCCPMIRWAATISFVPGLLSFWAAFSIYMCLVVLNSLTAEIFCWALLVMVCTFYRQKIRHTLDMTEKGGMTWVTDCILYCFCGCCLITQEARQIEDGCKAGLPQLRQPCEEEPLGTSAT